MTTILSSSCGFCLWAFAEGGAGCLALISGSGAASGRRKVPRDDLEEAKVHPVPFLANTQDADELGATVDVPSWQIPDLVVECPKRPGARIHKGTSLILPEAGGDLLACIVRSLPVLLQIRPRWILGYSMAVDGLSLDPSM
eukprot:g12674.t1